MKLASSIPCCDMKMRNKTNRFPQTFECCMRHSRGANDPNAGSPCECCGDGARSTQEKFLI